MKVEDCSRGSGTAHPPSPPAHPRPNLTPFDWSPGPHCPKGRDVTGECALAVQRVPVPQGLLLYSNAVSAGKGAVVLRHAVNFSPFLIQVAETVTTPELARPHTFVVDVPAEGSKPGLLLASAPDVHVLHTSDLPHLQPTPHGSRPMQGPPGGSRFVVIISLWDRHCGHGAPMGVTDGGWRVSDGGWGVNRRRLGGNREHCILSA